MIRSILKSSLSLSSCRRCWVGAKPQRFLGTTTTPSTAPSTTGWILQSDVGPFSTRVHHTLTLILAGITPIYFVVPDRMTNDTFFGKAYGLLLSVTMTVHSQIGMNYVATDYVPKISRALLGPSRIVIFAMNGIMLLGMCRLSVASPGGLKGVVKGVWNPLPKPQDPQL